MMITLRASRARDSEIPPGRCGDHVRHVGGVERGGDLGVEIDAVDHDDHRGIAELGMRGGACAPRTPSGGSFRTLEVPDEPLADPPRWRVPRSGSSPYCW